MNHFSNKNYFTMPNEIFSLGLDASEIAVYAYLRCLENRSTYQCWPSYSGSCRCTMSPPYLPRRPPPQGQYAPPSFG